MENSLDVSVYHVCVAINMDIFVLPNLAAQYCVQRNLRLCDAEDGRKEVAIDETDLLEWI